MPELTRFPQFKSISLGVGRPPESTIGFVFNAVLDFYSGSADCASMASKIGNPVIEHALAPARSKVLCVFGERQPHRLLARAARDDSAVGLVRLNRHTQVLAIPSGHTLRVASFEENPADAERGCSMRTSRFSFVVRASLLPPPPGGNFPQRITDTPPLRNTRGRVSF